MRAEQQTALYRGDVSVVPTQDARAFYGATVDDMAIHRRDDILIALEVNSEEVAGAIAQALGNGFSSTEPPSVAFRTDDIAAGFDVALSQLPIGADRSGRPQVVSSNAIASAVDHWIAGRARKVALWDVAVRVTAVEDDSKRARDGRAAKAAQAEPKVQQPVLWGLGAIMLLLGLTLGGFLLVSFLAVGD